MTEAEWLGTVDHPRDMLEFLEHRELFQKAAPNFRKWELYQAACHRCVRGSIPREWEEPRSADYAFGRARFFDYALYAAEYYGDHNGDDYGPTCDLLRDIFGNPFTPIVFDAAWRSAAVVGIAQSIYADDGCAGLPILADALEDAGCDNADILDHCRNGGEHVRGCWVVDLVLDKE